MKLKIRQRMFALADTYDIYDEKDQPKYYVRNEILSLLHHIHVYDKDEKEVGVIHQKFALAFPDFKIEMNGKIIGTISKDLSFFVPKYSIDYLGWKCQGDIFGFDYTVIDKEGKEILSIDKKIISLTGFTGRRIQSCQAGLYSRLKFRLFF